MNIHNDIDKRLEAYSEQISPTDSDNLTFIDAQLTYAKSKHCKQVQQKQKVYKKRWFKGDKK